MNEPSPDMPRETASALAPRTWLRRLTQFSLRTLLIGTTLAAVGCWWFLQPETREEEVAGKHLKLRRQVRLVKEDPSEAGTPVAGVEDEAMKIVSVGRWRLQNEHGDVLVAGRYDNDRKHGPWTTYYPNGRKAAQGEVFRGARTGLWRVWNEEGQLLSEVTYKAVEVSELVPSRPFFSPVSETWTALPPERMALFASVRHGPARGWYESGQLQFAGAYQNDRREGSWTHYDEQGRITAEGEYHDDLREGTWRLFDAESGSTQAEQFAAGRLRVEHEARLARFDRQIASGVARRQIVAIEQLAALKRHGQPRLVELLDHDSPHVRRLAAQRLARQQDLLPEATAKLDTLTSDEDGEVARWAMAAAYREGPQQREKLFDPLMASLQTTTDDEARLWIAGTVYDVDPDRRLAVLTTLGSLAEGDERIATYSAWAAAATDVADLLPAAFESPQPRVRCFVLYVVHQLSLRGIPTTVKQPSGASFLRYELPTELQPLVEAAKADPHPEVRKTAESVGIHPGLLNLGGGFF